MTSPERTAPWETEYAIAAGFAAAILGCVLAAWCFPPDAGTARLIVLALVVTLVSAVTRNAAACLPVAALAWLFCDGFLIGHYGELRWHGWPDAARLTCLIAATGLGTAIGRVTVRTGRPRPRYTGSSGSVRW